MAEDPVDTPVDLPGGVLPTETVRFTFPADPEDPPEDPPLPAVKPRKKFERTLPHELYEARVEIVAAMMQQGYTRARVAHALHMSLPAVAWCITQARKRELLQSGVIEAIGRLNDEAVPLAVEGLLHHLGKKDKEAVFKTLEGRGLLVHHASNKNESTGPAAPLAFQFNFVTKDGEIAPAPELPALPGQVIGIAREE